MAKHFFKLLVIFAIMIILGLAGIFLVNYFGQNDAQSNVSNSTGTVAN